MRYSVIDIVLDTMPYSGGDTTVAALDMGIPVVTRCGDRHAERMSYSILAHLGITATVAHTDADYVDHRLPARHRSGMARRRERRDPAPARDSPLADPRHYARCLEDALQRAVTTKITGTLLKATMHLHILGICGTFMGGIAAIAKRAGHTVTGCDANVYPPMSTQLEALGIGLTEGWDAGAARRRREATPTCS